MFGNNPEVLNYYTILHACQLNIYLFQSINNKLEFRFEIISAVVAISFKFLE